MNASQQVGGMTRSEDQRDVARTLGAAPVVADALEAAQVAAVVAHAKRK